MPAARVFRTLLVAVLIMLGFVPMTLSAQDATPVTDAPEASGPGQVIAGGLTHPRGMTWGADDTLFVALAGSGGSNPATEEAPTTEVIGPWTGGPTAAVAEIDEAGCPVGLATGLPSTVDAMGGVLGADDVAILGDQLYVAVDGGGPVHGNPDDPSGVYRIIEDGSTELIADLSEWVRDNPVETVPGDFDPDAAGYSIVADEDEDLLWVNDPNSGQIMTVTPDGEIERIADLSAEHPVPTKMSLDPEGGVFVGMLTVVPFPDGAAKVVHVDLDGTVTDVWTGLTAVVDVAEGLMFPVALDVGPDGALYVAMPALGAFGGEGTITRIPVGDAEETVADAPDNPTSCAPIPETLSGGPATPEAPQATPITSADEDEDEGQAEAGDEATVTIVDFSFGPDTLEIAASTTVTFVNEDSAPHTATAEDGSFDTGSIDGGESASVTFDEPGTYDYACSFHPSMSGTIVVT